MKSLLNVTMTIYLIINPALTSPFITSIICSSLIEHYLPTTTFAKRIILSFR